MQERGLRGPEGCFGVQKIRFLGAIRLFWGARRMFGVARMIFWVARRMRWGVKRSGEFCIF